MLDYVYADSTAGQSALYQVGCTGIPVVNVNNNCSTGSTALFLARQSDRSGVAECVLAFGFEQMLPGALGAVFTDRKRSLDHHLSRQDALLGRDEGAPLVAQQFGGAGPRLSEPVRRADDVVRHDRPSRRARMRSNNPLALFRKLADRSTK